MASRDQWFPAAKEPNVVGRFEYKEDLDVVASKEADEKRYRKIIVCWTKVVGDPDENCLPVRDFNRAELISRFPDAWKAFQGEDIPVKGVPLTELPGMTESRIVDFRINAIYTVEQVAALSDASCERIGFGTRKLRGDAQALLDQRKALAEQAVMQAAQALLVEKSTPKRRGRPAKQAVAA